MYLFPVTGIHSIRVNWEAEPGGSIASVTAFSLVAFLILVIACLNFINLSTARASKRAKEVGIRKTIGAAQHQLRRQFIHESLLLTFVSLGLAFVLGEFSVRAVNRLFSGDLTLAPLFEPLNLAVIIAAAVVLGILAGLYPAFYMTVQPAGVAGEVRSEGEVPFPQEHGGHPIRRHDRHHDRDVHRVQAIALHPNALLGL
jgi:putative ABC transport system permease protein